MAFSRPSLARLINRAQADIESLLQNGAARVRRSVEWVLSKVAAGLTHGLHGHIDYVSKQIIPDTAEDEFAVRWASFWGVERNAATQAEFSITVTGVPTTTLDAGTVYQRADGVLFETTADFDVGDPSGEVSVTVRAVEAGSDGNTTAAAILSLVSPVVDIDADATVEGGAGELMGGGADIEAVTALKQRLQDRVQTPPSGGGPGDYEDWAKEVDGVSRAWELPQQLGPGTVVVLFVQDAFDDDGNFESTTFPAAPAISEVQDYIDARAPVTAVVTVQAPIEMELDPSIQLDPNTADVQEQVIAQLNDLLLRRAGPGETLLLSEINEAISLAAGESDHVLVSPVANILAGTTEVITLGTPIFAVIP